MDIEFHDEEVFKRPKGIKFRDVIQFNWYQYAIKGFTDDQKSRYGRNVRYYSNVLIATPKWSKDHEVWDWFLRARLMREQGDDVQVDHMVPINHPHVCGLHCVDNFQLLGKAPNEIKGNNFWPDMWGEQMELEL